MLNFDPRISDSCDALHVLRDLPLVHELLEQPARFAAAEDVGRDVRVGVAGLEDCRRQPRHVDARQLDRDRYDRRAARR